MKRGTLIILSGPSGVGKGTVREQLFKMDDLNLAYSISLSLSAIHMAHLKTKSKKCLKKGKMLS